MIALLQAQKAGLLAPKHWLPNIIAGLIVGIVALPLAMAFAIASGVKPEQGIYTAIIAGLAVSVLGGSKVQIAGPTGAFIVILAGIVAQYGIEGLQIATLMAGVILLLLGLLRLGAVIRYIPDPVIIGFTAGIGVIIWVGQWRDFFGLPQVQGTHFHQKLWFLLSHIGQLNIATTVLGVLALAILIMAPRVRWLARIPGPLIALIVVTLLQALFQFKGVSTIGSAFGEIPRGLPAFQLPDIRLSKVIELIGPAFAIAMLGAIESLLSAVVADNMTGDRHDSNQELVGQGVANILAPMFGGIAATGAIARTATNIRNGGTSPIAGIVHCLVLVLILMVLAPLASYIPLTSLAAILFMVAWNMSQVRILIQMQKRAPWIDLLILWVTFALTVLADLVVAVNIGVVLAMLYVLKRTADSVQVRLQSEREVRRAADWPSTTPLPAHTAVYSIEGPMFFAAVEAFQQAMENLPQDARYIVLRLNYVPFLDVTALQVIEGALQQLHAQKRQLLLSEANDKVRNKLKRMGVMGLVFERNVYPNLEDALCAVQRAQVQAMDE
ncbi:SulP family inorganic anion transporter [Alcaligenes endophyticus]|uniref:STAS domain-containing protein n=1 Tax=Alcaligenes endophyticus TaxID=1929088 RepID=A0ABT8ELN3_9BURK|nr:SulP family inorganic anion transporter [Alcaligenes endophyticus]MCX5590526.1 SulP family inorganic anion transporter [Alcaligenes endophyticus]MDN4122110.1 STAS domain-containing protein [Alcaligenes endophyticus]